jgi:hypothetical protein
MVVVIGAKKEYKHTRHPLMVEKSHVHDDIQFTTLETTKLLKVSVGTLNKM